MSHRCSVCGYLGLEHPPRGGDGGGSLEICPCCGFQHGFDDDDRSVTPEAWRSEWIKGGLRWWSRGTAAPAGWDATAQLTSLEAKPPRRRRGKK
jgi:hypothetical protein